MLPLSSTSKDRRGFAVPCIDSRSVFMSCTQCDALPLLAKAISFIPIWQAYDFRITLSCHKMTNRRSPPFHRFIVCHRAINR